MTTEELAAFYDKLTVHDWHYSFSDYGPSYRRGEENERIISREAYADPEKLALLTAYKKYVNSGMTTDRLPRPDRPGGPKPKKDESAFISEIGF